MLFCLLHLLSFGGLAGGKRRVFAPLGKRPEGSAAERKRGRTAPGSGANCPKQATPSQPPKRNKSPFEPCSPPLGGREGG